MIPSTRPSTGRVRGSLRASRVLMGLCAALMLSATEARAQSMSFGTFHGYFTGFIGGTMAGDVDENRMTAGGSVSVQESTGWGAEFDFGRTTDALVSGRELDLTTYMFNMTYVSPSKRIRPFAAAGGGLHQVDDGRLMAKTYDLGLSAGGGVFLLANDVFGIRADARYFFSLGEHPELSRPDRLSHWRLGIGVTYLWQIAP
jgi:hypothetical protein